MAALFGHGNPLATQVGQLIERATDGSQASENWGLFMEVCDLINETDEGPKDAVKAIRKRLSQNMGKNHTAIMYTLTCLETCVKNCGRRFHLQVATKDFLQEMIKVIGPKYDPPQAVQEKVLSLIQTWADAFKGSPELKEVEKIYQDLKGKGIEFPMTDLDHFAPIHTPARSAPETDPGLNRLRPASGRAPAQPTMMHPAHTPQLVPQQMPAMGPINPSPEQLAKLKSELNLVQGNIRVMSEMLTELSPANIDPSDLELLQELHRTNRQMQQRLVELLDKVANEEATSELLRINDDLNNVFLRYERFERYRTGQSGGSSASLTNQTPEQPNTDFQLPPSYEQVSASQPPSVGNLIDLGEDFSATNSTAGITNQMSGMGLGSNVPAAPASTGPPPPPAEDDFDMFAQSRKSFDTNKQTLGSYANQSEDQYTTGGLGTAVNTRTTPASFTNDESEVLKLQEKETDYDEMEQWLTSEQKASLKAETRPKESISSSEFDSFLAERATVAESLPSISAATGQRSNNRNRQLQKDEEENPLFAL